MWHFTIPITWQGKSAKQNIVCLHNKTINRKFFWAPIPTILGWNQNSGNSFWGITLLFTFGITCAWRKYNSSSIVDLHNLWSLISIRLVILEILEFQESVIFPMDSTVIPNTSTEWCEECIANLQPLVMKLKKGTNLTWDIWCVSLLRSKRVTRTENCRSKWVSRKYIRNNSPKINQAKHVLYYICNPLIYKNMCN